jgi:hypothetical protein
MARLCGSEETGAVCRFSELMGGCGCEGDQSHAVSTHEGLDYHEDFI